MMHINDFPRPPTTMATGYTGPHASITRPMSRHGEQAAREEDTRYAMSARVYRSRMTL